MKVIKNSFIYIITTLIPRGIGFLLLPVLTLYLNPHDYGVANVVESLRELLLIFFLFGFDFAGVFFHYKHLDDLKKQKEFWSTLAIFVLFMPALITVGLYAFHQIILDPFVKGIAFNPYLRLGITTAAIVPFYQLYLAFLKSKQTGKQLGLFKLSFALFDTALLVFFVCFVQLKAKGVLVAHFFSFGLFFILAILLFFPKIGFCFRLKYLKSAFKYSLPLIPHNLSGWITSLIDRLFLYRLHSSAAVGIYSLGFKFGLAMQLVVIAVQEAFSPWFFEKMRNNSTKEIVLFTELFAVIFGFLALGLSLFSKEIIVFLMSDTYQEAWKIVSILSFAFVFHGLCEFFSQPLFLKKTKYVAFIFLIGVSTNILINIFFTPKYAIYAAALATFSAHFIRSIIALIISSRLKIVPFKWKQMYASVGIFFVLSFSNFFLEDVSILSGFLIKVGLFLLITILLYFRYKKEIQLLFSTFLKKKDVSQTIEPPLL